MSEIKDTLISIDDIKSNNTINVIFIIPYRNREEHKQFYINHMKNIVKIEKLNAIFIFAHQCDDLLFNRGLMLNIGFLEAKKINPKALIVMQDIDILPKNPFDYQWIPENNTIRHVIGEKNINLGGIISFKNHDLFESVNGFPNYYGWGPEDWTLRRRFEQKNIKIDENNQKHHRDTNVSIMLPHIPSNTPAIRKLVPIRKKYYEFECQNAIIIDGLDNINYSCQYNLIESNFYLCNITHTLKNNIYE